ncbi:nitric oxide dioxygenase [Volucribacter psittacicida]|uniref:Flavohemoprotein n=1 Tax=Volucribacter psittacicida TaxID=203482 RepID=A0A4R1FL29_9PAST|nr:NO-inducible flavohemoprotein [Volucribacter psittacicida]TCJ93969.1 nitric oxide dioxygenase [Volucribacter psittacicida]
MALNKHQIELIQSTIPVLKENGADLTAYFYQRMLGNNPELKETFNLGHQRSGAQARSLAGAVLAYAENIEHLERLGSAVSLMAHKHVSLNIQPEQYAIVGENLLHSISEVLNIPMEHELISAWAAAYQQLADILINAEADLYRQQQQTPYGWNGWKAFKIIDRQAESDEITSFYLAPVDGGKLPQYQAGQYISLRIPVPELGLKQPRQYSLSDRYHPDYFRISVKNETAHDGLPEGYVSTTLHRDYHVGDIVEVTHPTGDFVLQHQDKDTVLISAGVGVTPMIAMLNTLLATHHPIQISFLHACRHIGALAMHQHIEQLKQQHPNLYSYLACETPSEQVKIDQLGRLDLKAIDRQYLPAQADYYLCGPKAFMQQQYQTLRELGIPAAQIYMELFNTGGIADIEE